MDKICVYLNKKLNTMPCLEYVPTYLVKATRLTQWWRSKMTSMKVPTKVTLHTKKKKNVLRYAKYLYRMKSFNLHITQFQKLKNCSVCNTYNLIFILTFTMAVTLHAVFVCRPVASGWAHMPPPQFLEDQLTLSQPGGVEGHIMPTTSRWTILITIKPNFNKSEFKYYPLFKVRYVWR